MSKAVLISIRPEWTRLILNGEKTIEVRKTRPKLETPFKCYIYQTLPKIGDWNDRDGHVIGEFVCDEIKTIDIPYPAYWTERHKRELDGSCLTLQQAHSYLGSSCGYGWHISELKVYDEPKKLREFTPCCKYMLDEKQCDYQKILCPLQQDSFFAEDGCNCMNFVKRPPQSFCYVEELS